MQTITSERDEIDGLLTVAGLREAVAALAGVEAGALGDDDDLIGAGVDSLGIMRLANRFRAAGVEVKAADLMEAPTLAAWVALAASAPRRQPRSVGGPTPAGETGQGAAAGEPFPLAAMQHAYWVGRMPGHPLSVASHFYCEFEGPEIDPGRLERAARALTRRHPMLRARFLDDGRQQVMPESTWRGVTVHDLAAAGDSERGASLAAIRERESNRRLGVADGEVFDLQISRLPAGRCRLHVNVDMLVADAASFRTALDELAQLFADPSVQLLPVAYDVARYHLDAGAHRERGRAAAASYWQALIDDLPAPPQLPLALDPADLEVPRVTRREHWLTRAEHERLRERCREHRVTVSMALATAYAEVLGRFAAEPRFLLNLPLFDRRPVHADVPRLVGDFTSLLLLATDTSGDMPFAERSRRLQDRFHSDVRHGDYSGVDVLRDVARRQPGTVPSAPVVFTSALGMGDLFGDRVRATFGDLVWMISQTAQVWLDHQVTEDDGRILLNWDAVEPLFPEGCLDAMFDAYVGAVRWMLRPESDWSVTPLPVELSPDQEAVRARVNATTGPVRQGGLHEPFFARAAEQPGALAIAWGDSGTMTYGELAAAARHLARSLVAAGVAPGDCVAVSMPKGPRQAVAVLGTLLAGATYVPVGLDVPPERRDRIFAAARARTVVVADDHPLDRPPVKPLAIGELVEPGAEDGVELPAATIAADSLAYVIFTSGSTGEPKGVMVPHRAAVNTVEDLNERCRVGPDDRVLAVSSLDFDLSVYDLFGMLSAGGAVVMVEEGARRDAERWLQLVRRWGVTIWQSVPALLDMLLAAAGDDPVAGLRYALVGGDWPAIDLGSRLARGAPGCRLVALGGTTETAIHSTWFVVDEIPDGWTSVPWGVPLRNVRCRVVDTRGRDCPDWVPGELWIGGASVAAGYRGDPERTMRQFVELGGARWYRTGDFARYRPDGNLEFLGRRDHQVKVRGHRIELGDVERAFESCPGVAQAVAIGMGERGHQQLAVAVVGPSPAAEHAASTVAGLRASAAERLPAYMVPENVAVLDRFPLSANGKIDRPAIGRLLSDRRGAGAGVVGTDGREAPPQGPFEEAIAAIWRRLLGVEAVGREESFFALGGDSLLATQFVQEARRTLRVDVPLRRLFETPTIGGLAAVAGTPGPGTAGELVEEGVL